MTTTSVSLHCIALQTAREVGDDDLDQGSMTVWKMAWARGDAGRRAERSALLGGVGGFRGQERSQRVGASACVAHGWRAGDGESSGAG